MQLDLLLATLSPLLDQATELAPDARAAWLAGLRREQPGLAAELESLLGSEAEMVAAGFLSRSGAAELLGVPPAGGQVGPYALVRPLGHGGMGSVWLGQRNDGRYEGQVAVKLLSGALLHPAGAERFRREANALARLTHPGIARLIDAGVSPAGQSYLVLEYVDGGRIDEYCDAHRLTPGRRLELFQQVLGAVAHAHASLIVHRDIKPSNILVTPDGRAKLLDFGIAKLLEPDSAARPDSGLTEGGGIACTPGFAAPEQLTGGAITTATDVYALGVLLYLLLTGRHPTGADGANTAAALRRIVEVEPGRLSAPVDPGAAALRGMSPDRLRRLCAGDLENILAKALEKVPERRYPTVVALGADLDRFVRHEPVEARTASMAERARKFVRRHRAPVALGLPTAAALIGATVVTSAQMLEAKRQAERARLERDRAIGQEERAIASSGFMDFLLENIATSGKAYTTSELLDRARTLLDRDYPADSRFAARMMVDLSAHYYRLRDRERQIGLLTRAAELATAANDPETLAYANCWLGLTRAFDGDVPAATTHLARADRLLKTVHDAPLALRIRCLLAHSNLARRTGQIDSAVGFARSAIALSDSAGDTTSYRRHTVLNELSGVLTTAGRFREALEVTRSSIGLLSRSGRDSTATFTVEVYNEARSLAALGELSLADSTLGDAMRLAAAMDPAGRLPSYMTALAGDLADELGRPAVALEALERARADAHGQRDPAGEARALASLIRVLLEQRQLGRAARDSAALAPLLSAGDHSVMTFLAACRAEAEQRWPEAQRLFAEYLLSGSARPRGAIAYRYPHVVTLAATAALNAGDSVAADTLSRRAIRLARAEGDDDARSATIGDALTLQGRLRLPADPRSARQQFQRALVARTSAYGPGHARTRSSRISSSHWSRAPVARQNEFRHTLRSISRYHWSSRASLVHCGSLRRDALERCLRAGARFRPGHRRYVEGQCQGAGPAEGCAARRDRSCRQQRQLGHRDRALAPQGRPALARDRRRVGGLQAQAQGPDPHALRGRLDQAGVVSATGAAHAAARERSRAR